MWDELEQVRSRRPHLDPRRWSKLRTGAAASAAAIVAFAVASSVIPGGGGTAPPAGVATAPPAAEATPTAVDPAAEPAADAGGIDGPVVEHEGRRFQVGQAGDLVAVDDWHCTGGALVALYRPATGAVFVFGSWPHPGERVETTALTVTPSGTDLGPGEGSGGCPTLVVAGPDGPLTVLTSEELR